MLTDTHGHVARALLLACGWDLNDAQIAGVAGIATDKATPGFIGETHLIDFPHLGMPACTQVDISLEQAGSNWYPGWRTLARWHGGWASLIGDARAIQIGDHDDRVVAAVEDIDWALDYEGPVTRQMIIRLGMELHAALDTATHCGFWPCWHPQNRNPEYRRAWWKLWQSAIPPILHAQYLDEVDRIEGEGRDGITGSPVSTAFKVKLQLYRLQPILHRPGANDGAFAALIDAVRKAENDEDLRARCDALAIEITGAELQPMVCWERGGAEWREFFAVARRG